MTAADKAFQDKVLAAVSVLVLWSLVADLL